MRRKCLQCSPKIWCFLVFEVSRVRCFAYVVISCYSEEIHAAAYTNCFDRIRQSVSVCFSSLRVDDWCTNCCISAKNENNSAILSSHISNFLNFNPTFKCFWWKCTNKNRECDGVCVWEWLRGDSGSAVTVGPTPSCSFCIYWKFFKPETFPSNLTPIDSQVPPRSSDLSSETSLSLDGSRCSPRCCFQLIFSLSLHFYLAAYIFNDVLRSRTWMIKHHIMKLRVWRRAFSVERLALNVGGWILKWKSCLYVCENIYILSFFLISHISHLQQLQLRPAAPSVQDAAVCFHSTADLFWRRQMSDKAPGLIQ